MLYKGLVSNGYIIGFAGVPDGVLTEEQVSQIIRSKPQGNGEEDYRLKENYVWEKYEKGSETESI